MSILASLLHGVYSLAGITLLASLLHGVYSLAGITLLDC
jgi:hypothetical protein